MKTRLNKKFIERAKICALRGYLDKPGRYCEVRVNNILLNTLPREIIKEVSSGYDITIQTLPKRKIVVFAKSPQIMDQYVAEMGENHIRDMFGAMSRYNNPDDGPLWATYDLENLMV